ncbi:MBL fold metallo-hydrolase [Enterovirga sp.]|uniref:MBL fold metallo-hydrolase n=1 Tax=Enterovirga sp. TaxID=2026350 RepID=UPI00261EA6D9|nr:MBL fold metallo-hydrolase [Enterovirga sp.]MDB5590513.1 fold metallo-hydrolase [Enterovirga sp.]
MLTRRTVVAAVPAAAAAGSVQAQTPAAPPAAGSAAEQAPGFYRYKVGDIEVTAVNDGFFHRAVEGLVRNAETGDVKKVLQEEFLPETAIQVPFTTLVLRSGGRTVLVDAGNGDSGAPTSGRWMANFRAAGFDPAQVNAVVISHFHGDHINGLRLKSGQAVFPNAEIHVPEPEWAYWTDQAKMAAAPDGLKPNFQNVQRVFGPVAKDVKPYGNGKEVVPGLTSVAAPGHTPGHTAYMLASGTSKLMIMSDTANHPALFVRNPGWAAVFDMDAETARQSRIKLLDMAASERAQVSFYHAPFPATGYIAKEGAGYRFVPVQWTPAV